MTYPLSYKFTPPPKQDITQDPFFKSSKSSLNSGLLSFYWLPNKNERTQFSLQCMYSCGWTDGFISFQRILAIRYWSHWYKVIYASVYVSDGNNQMIIPPRSLFPRCLKGVMFRSIKAGIMLGRFVTTLILFLKLSCCWANPVTTGM